MTLTRNALPYSFEYDRVATGHAIMRSMGLPTNQAPFVEFSDTELRDLAGDMFSIPIMAVVSDELLNAS
jgi:hypothetical protein